MPNKYYLRGKKKEQKIANALKAEGFEIAQRSAGSHSPIDVFGINREKRLILFIQSKPLNFRLKEKELLMKKLGYLTGVWDVKFEIR